MLLVFMSPWIFYTKIWTSKLTKYDFSESDFIVHRICDFYKEPKQKIETCTLQKMLKTGAGSFCVSKGFKEEMAYRGQRF